MFEPKSPKIKSVDDLIKNQRSDSVSESKEELPDISYGTGVKTVIEDHTKRKAEEENDDNTKIAPILLLGAIGGSALYFLRKKKDSDHKVNTGETGSIIKGMDELEILNVIEKKKYGIDLTVDEGIVYRNNKQLIDDASALGISDVAISIENVAISEKNGVPHIDSFSASKLPSVEYKLNTLNYETSISTDIDHANKLISDNKIPSFFYGYEDTFVRGVGSIVSQKTITIDKYVGEHVEASSSNSVGYVDFEDTSNSNSLLVYSRNIILLPVVKTKIGYVLGAKTLLLADTSKTYSVVKLRPQKLNTILFNGFISTEHVPGKKSFLCKGKGQDVRRLRYRAHIAPGAIVSFLVLNPNFNNNLYILRKDENVSG